MSQILTLPPPDEVRFELVVRTRDTSRAVLLDQNKVVGVGRGEENLVRLDCPSVSRLHLQLHPSSGGFEVEDLGSSNGTVLIRGSSALGGAEDAGLGSQVRLTAHERWPMNVGDALRVGSALISLQAKRRSMPPAA